MLPLIKQINKKKICISFMLLSIGNAHIPFSLYRNIKTSIKTKILNNSACFRVNFYNRFKVIFWAN